MASKSNGGYGLRLKNDNDYRAFIDGTVKIKRIKMELDKELLNSNSRRLDSYYKTILERVNVCVKAMEGKIEDYELNSKTWR